MKTKQGISLIVLVITIIVMVVLAGAIVLTLNNSGIIQKATDAVDKTNYATVKELTQMAWAEAYANGARTQAEFQDAVDKALEDNKIDTDKYGIIVTTNGVEVANGWIQDGLTVKRGDTVLNIGSNFEYDSGVESYEGGWKVLGAENGELLIMSTIDIVSSYILGDETYTPIEVTGENLEEAQNDWLHGAADLDSLCEPYGKGKRATGARSIRVEDVDKITGFDKTTYGKGQIYEYGNIVTYSYNGTSNPTYVGANGITGTLSQAHDNGFYFYNGKEIIHINDLTTGEKGTTFATLKSDYYGYYLPRLEIIDKTSDAYTMLFGEYGNEDAWYWLASPYVYTDTNYANFGMRFVEEGLVDCNTLWSSNGYSEYYDYGVRAVVSLSSNINVTGSSETGWTY